MIISTTDKSIRIQYGNEIYTHPMNSISYAINEDTTGITFFSKRRTHRHGSSEKNNGEWRGTDFSEFRLGFE